MRHTPEPACAQRLEVPCTFAQAEFDRFADLSGDHNPIHVDPVYATRTAFGATVAHGMLLYTRLRGLMAQAYPGWVQRTQTLMFPAPSYAGEALTLVLEGASDGAHGVRVNIQVQKADGRLGLDGTATLLPHARPDPPHGDGYLAGACGSGAFSAPPVQVVEKASIPDGLPAFAALRSGDAAHIVRGYAAADLCTWARLARQPEAPRHVPEPLIAALFSYLLGEQVPGHGTNYLKQSMTFYASARVDEVLDARVAITRLRPDKALVNLSTHCTGEHGRALCSGEALVLFKC